MVLDFFHTTEVEVGNSQRQRRDEHCNMHVHMVEMMMFKESSIEKGRITIIDITITLPSLILFYPGLMFGDTLVSTMNVQLRKEPLLMLCSMDGA